MRNYTTQMDAAKRGIITPEMKAVAKKEYRTEEENYHQTTGTTTPQRSPENAWRTGYRNFQLGNKE